MQANSDAEFVWFKDLDFADAKTVAKIPHLRKLQASAGAKSRITMRVDSDVVAIFRARAELSGGNYQTMMNEAPKQFAQGMTLSEMLDSSVRETIAEALGSAPHRPARKRVSA